MLVCAATVNCIIALYKLTSVPVWLLLTTAMCVDDNKLVVLQSAEQVTHFCRMAHEILEPAGANPVIQPRSQPMSDAQKLRKVILELINTEKAYVRDLCMLMER